jgi:hypothetical protein
VIALLGILFPFVKGLLGDGIVEKLLNHKRDLATNATAIEKANIEADVKTLELELQRRAQIKELQIREYEHPLLWWPKALIMMSVALYVFARFTVKTFGLDDYHVAVAELDAWEAGIASAVMAYLFLGSSLSRAVRG